ncbi:MAG TPA: cbb3-type cytochrome c oxidase N-terminal domain-containing protein [Candidatus Polarisedimenticolaceae bacterium]|nr:cbb3-type cytochrome c oxidase N-terminal domain-containing protein [Candidatus Polarisedimenticolaceae bacterium]
MSEPEVFDHEYDGIREYDNPLPGWWKAIFIASVVFSVWYAVEYHGGHGETVQAQYDREMLELYDLQAKEILKLGPITDQTILEVGTKGDVLAGARGLFAQRCAVCHGAAGQGNIGPNLTDDYWLHGGKPTDIHRTIAEGVPAKGMVAWKAQLPAGQILALSSYVVSLHGTNPPNPKAPQGDKAP